jgi:hypothetical protein
MTARSDLFCLRFVGVGFFSLCLLSRVGHAEDFTTFGLARRRLGPTGISQIVYGNFLIATTLYRISKLLVPARPVFLEHGSTCIDENAYLQKHDGRITCSSYVLDFFLLALDFVFLELEGRHQVDPTAGMDHHGGAFL